MTRRHLRCFTLIELLVVVIIIAVMAGVAVPAYSRLAAKTRFDSVVSEVQDLFGYAREQAVSKDTVVTLTYDAQGEVFMVNAVPSVPMLDLPTSEIGEMRNGTTSNNATIQSSVTRMVQLPVGYVVNFKTEGDMSDSSRAGGQQLGTGINAVHFHGDGTSDGAELMLMSRDGDTDLKLSPATGRLKLVDPNGGRPPN